MALPGVSITLTNGALGLVAPGEDSVVGIIFNGVAASGLSLGVSFQGFDLADFEAVGVTSAYDTTNSVEVWRHIKEFYDEAGEGAELWIMIVSQATNAQTILDKTTANAKKLLQDAGGRIRLLAVARNPAGGYTPNTTANEIDLDIVNALTTGQALADDFQAAFTPVRIILEAYAFTGTTSTLANLKAQTKPNMAILLGDTESGARSAVGLLLGRLASVPVQRNPGRVKDGSLLITAAYLGSATLESDESKATAIHDKGFITFRKHPGKAGYYFSDDPTCVAANDDYSSLARGRVIDKAIRIAAETFTNELLDEVQIDANGRISTNKAKYYQAIIDNAVNTAMTAEGEISAFESFVDDQQNVLSTNKICIELRITPVGYAKQIEIQLGFNNPAN
ncbi:MAG: hypothetical protein EPGJADBJ_04477 [Saprospiraceae bacterium]|nr:hypothetical protein [Saprospiraceae bacterium]